MSSPRVERRDEAVALDADPGDISTIQDEGSADEARRAVEEPREGIVS
jgi:hypothetical protein